MQIVFMIFALLSVAAIILLYKRAPQQVVVLVPLITGVISTIFSVYAAIRSGKDKQSAPKGQARKGKANVKPFRVAPSFKSGFVGGLIGGGLGGLVSGILYYLSARHPVPGLLPATWDHILWNFSFGCVCGAVFGSISQFFILRIRHLLPNSILSDVIGGILGGGLAGVILGFWAVALFGNLKRAAADPRVLLAGGIFSAICIVLGVLLYDHKERGSTIKRTLILLLPVTLIVTTMGLYVFVASGIDEKYFITDDDTKLLIKRGAILATLLGALWGLILGLTLALYRLIFKPATSPEMS